MTSQNSKAKMSPMRTSGVSASPVRTSPLRGNRGDWSEKEVEYITTLLTSSKTKKKVLSPHTYLLRTLRTCYQLTLDSILPPFSLKWTKQGMTVGGRCLIPKISESRRTESACSLSQILEAEVDGKYYLTAEKQLIGGMQGYRVYDTDGISATLVGNAGGIGAKTGLYFIDQSNTAPKVTDTARCLTARYNAGIINHAAVNSAVLEVRPVLTPERMEKRQNGRRMKEDGEPMFTLTSQDRHGVYICEKEDQSGVKVKNATKAGYEEAHIGDSINLAYPESSTRRGRVGKGCSQTLDCSGQMGTLMKGGRIRRLTPRECFRLQGFPDELYEKAAAVNSDAQLYKQAGNAVTATVAYAVAMSLPESREPDIF